MCGKVLGSDKVVCKLLGGGGRVLACLCLGFTSLGLSLDLVLLSESLRFYLRFSA